MSEQELLGGLVQGGGLALFAVATFMLLRGHVARVEKILADQVVETRRSAVAMESLAAEIRELRGDVTPIPRPAFQRETPPTGTTYGPLRPRRGEP